MRLPKKILTAPSALPKVNNRALAKKARAKLFEILKMSALPKGNADVRFDFVYTPGSINGRACETAISGGDLYELVSSQKSPSWGWDMFTQGNGAIDEVAPYFPSLDTEELAIVCDAYSVHLADMDSSVDDIVGLFESGDIGSVGYECEFEDGEADGEADGIDYASEVYEACKAFREDCELNPLMERFFSDLSDLCSGMFSISFLIENFHIWLEVLFGGGGAMEVLTYSSKEVYAYQKYRNKLPKDVQDEADGWVEFFSHPFGMADEGDCELYFETNSESEAVSIMIPFWSGIDPQEDVSPLYKGCLDYVFTELPKLREQYSSITIGDAKASPLVMP